MRHIVFDSKGQQTERVSMRKEPLEGFFKKSFMWNFEKFTRKHL